MQKNIFQSFLLVMISVSFPVHDVSGSHPKKKHHSRKSFSVAFCASVKFRVFFFHIHSCEGQRGKKVRKYIHVKSKRFLTLIVYMKLVTRERERERIESKIL
jgi:hypothetical protein